MVTKTQFDEAIGNIDVRFDDLKKDLLEIKENIIQRLLKENDRLNKKVDYLQDRIKNIETDTYAHQQYGRRNNIEINGIPDKAPDEALESKFIDILSTIDVNVNKNKIEACHRLPNKTNKNKVTIVRFISRKKCEKALANKKKLRKNIFINENLCPYYKWIAWRCRQLKRANLIAYTWVAGGIGHMKKHIDDFCPVKIKHELDLIENFP